jgi:hypothetical protein
MAEGGETPRVSLLQRLRNSIGRRHETPETKSVPDTLRGARPTEEIKKKAVQMGGAIPEDTYDRSTKIESYSEPYKKREREYGAPKPLGSEAARRKDLAETEAARTTAEYRKQAKERKPEPLQMKTVYIHNPNTHSVSKLGMKTGVDQLGYPVEKGVILPETLPDNWIVEVPGIDGTNKLYVRTSEENSKRATKQFKNNYPERDIPLFVDIVAFAEGTRDEELKRLKEEEGYIGPIPVEQVRHQLAEGKGVPPFLEKKAAPEPVRLRMPERKLPPGYKWVVAFRPDMPEGSPGTVTTATDLEIVNYYGASLKEEEPLAIPPLPESPKRQLLEVDLPEGKKEYYSVIKGAVLDKVAEAKFRGATGGAETENVLFVSKLDMSVGKNRKLLRPGSDFELINVNSYLKRHLPPRLQKMAA